MRTQLLRRPLHTGPVPFAPHSGHGRSPSPPTSYPHARHALGPSDARRYAITNPISSKAAIGHSGSITYIVRSAATPPGTTPLPANGNHRTAHRLADGPPSSELIPKNKAPPPPQS